MTHEQNIPRPPIEVTERARQMVLAVRDQDEEPERLALWIEVTGVEGREYAHDMYFELLDEAGEHDTVVREGDLAIVIPVGNLDLVSGAALDVQGDPFQGETLVLVNPNSPSPAVGAAPAADLTGDVAQRVMQVLERQVNPAIASHGGRAELVAVEDGAAYLRLGGGCQGCGMATVTLSQGIEVAIRDAVPEVAQVVDVTDHAAGSNPYFEAAKK